MKNSIDSIQIGKAGLTESLIAEIASRLKKHRKLRIKLLKSAIKGWDRKEIAREVAEKCNAHLQEVRGNTFILTQS